MIPRPVIGSTKDSLNQHNGWEQRYLAGRTGWDRGEPNPALIDWVNSKVMTPQRFLVPGCGRGYEVELLAERGHAVTAVDIAPSAIKELRSRLAARGLRADVFLENLFEWNPDRQFTAIFEQTCLCALPPRQWGEYVSRLKRWLAPGGILLALFVQTGKAGGPPWHCDPIVMRRLFHPREWLWEKRNALRVPHPSGFHELGVILRRPESGAVTGG
jgi:SAM-dependent methyltransferase